MSPRATVVVPTYNHGAHVGAAVDSALAQTVPCEVVVVDDGSTDNTRDVLARYGSQVTVVRFPENRGVARARNVGLEASTGEVVTFLDADDVLHPTKVAEQLAVLDADPDVGWVLCDVVVRRGLDEEHVSDRYGYASEVLNGYLYRLLGPRNFIPVMSPLVRRSVVDDAGWFNPDAALEDWDFWTRVSCVAEARYVPRVLADYVKRPRGRNARSLDQVGARVLLLNVGSGRRGSPSWHPLPGFLNLDKAAGWTMEEGLGFLPAGSVEGATASHVLMYLPSDREVWQRFLREVHRVLKPGGVLRVTEDDTSHPTSARRGGWQGSEPAVTLTNPKMMAEHLRQAGFDVHAVAEDTTFYRGATPLLQVFHGREPDVFFVEGVKP